MKQESVLSLSTLHKFDDKQPAQEMHYNMNAKRTMKQTCICILLCLPTVSAFSSMAVPYGRRESATTTVDKSTTTTTTTTTSAPWRVVLDIGREPLSTMPFHWARSGGRMPIKIPCDFVTQNDDDDNNKNNKKNAWSVQPQGDTVSFTGPDGAVVRPVQGGPCQISNDNKQVSFALTFPETLARRDVTIPAGTVITCTGRLYTQTEVDQLYQDFYQARDEAWQLGGELNDMMALDGPPKKWNEQTQQWEKRTKSINPFEWAQKRLAYTAAKTNQQTKNKQRPDPNALSERGPFPGMNDKVYVAKEGIARTQNGAVIGKWSMEPILNKPVSYRGN